MTKAVTYDAHQVQNVLQNIHCDYNKELIDTINGDWRLMDDTDEPKENSSRFLASHQKFVCTVIKSTFEKKGMDKTYHRSKWVWYLW